jgi:hypothetical protein
MPRRQIARQLRGDDLTKEMLGRWRFLVLLVLLGKTWL